MSVCVAVRIAGLTGFISAEGVDGRCERHAWPRAASRARPDQEQRRRADRGAHRAAVRVGAHL